MKVMQAVQPIPAQQQQQQQKKKAQPQQAKAKKQKPNAQCACGSGKKFKEVLQQQRCRVRSSEMYNDIKTTHELCWISC